jgi:hypothetical protein
MVEQDNTIYVIAAKESHGADHTRSLPDMPWWLVVFPLMACG